MELGCESIAFLMVFDKKSFQLSGQLVGEIASFIDANYIRQKRNSEFSSRAYRRSREMETDNAYNEEIYEECLHREEGERAIEKPVSFSDFAMGMSLEEKLENIGISFHDRLFELIDKAGLDNKDVWKRANLD